MVICRGCGHKVHEGRRCTGWVEMENGRMGCQCVVELEKEPQVEKNGACIVKWRKKGGAEVCVTRLKTGRDRELFRFLSQLVGQFGAVVVEGIEKVE